LEASEGVAFVGQSRAEIYAFTERVLVAQQYAAVGKKERGSVRRYLSKMTGLSLPQVARLIAKYRKSGKVEAESYRRHSFAAQYTDGDIALLAEVDRAHERLSGPATRRILERECQEFGKQDFQRLAGISVSHLYNLRRSLRYRRQAAVFELTRPTPVSIAERRKPDPRTVSVSKHGLQLISRVIL